MHFSAKLCHFISLCRLNRPIGAFLLILPCLWGLGLCSEKIDFLSFLLWGVYFFVAGNMMRSCGCVLNDIMDQKFDQQVLRTKNRPLANNSLSLTEGIFIFFGLLSVGGMFWLILNQNAKIVSLICLMGMMIYPLAKRYFFLPQLILGIVFNSGIWVVFYQFNVSFDTINTFACFYFMGICWTLLYDTIYAVQDLNDDLKIGIYSTAIFFKNNLKLFLYIVFCFMTFFAFLGLWYMDTHFLIYLFFPLMTVDEYRKIKNLLMDDQNMVNEYFKKSYVFGAKIFALICVDQLYKFYFFY